MFILEKDSRSIAAESYRTVRTNIQYSSIDKEYKIIMVTSSEPKEGKSSVAGNLALSFAQDDNRVLLIDCDLRKPSLHKKFRISNVIGLTDVLIGKGDLISSIKKYNDKLFILTSGNKSPNPAEMLSSKVMSKLLEELREKFDYIILDTPPVQAVADSQIISTKSDGVILVIRAEETKRDSTKSAVSLLRKVNANIIGAVFNGVDSSRNKYYYYYGEK